MRLISLFSILVVLANRPTFGQENRLSDASSPYLLQHADNPVWWQPWGDSAFERAFQEEKPIFLSIGYSACHWCQVMERESFEDRGVADLLNRYFVAIKVDREELPHVDRFYLDACRKMSSECGWPLTMLLTPDGEPFFSGTYFPPEQQYGRPGLIGILGQYGEAWSRGRDRIETAADMIALSLDEHEGEAPDSVDNAHILLETGLEQIMGRYDREWSGFGSSAKFPPSLELFFLLRNGVTDNDAESLAMVVETLDRMRDSGLYDQIGGGFHRYSSTRDWNTPHFEKMLYDQARMLLVYTRAWQRTGFQRFRQTAEELGYVMLGELQDANGAFMASLNAESGDREGAFYLWTTNELRGVLGSKKADIWGSRLGVTETGNFRDEITGEVTGENVLYGPVHSAEWTSDEWTQVRSELYKARQHRERPTVDSTILTDWNGQAIEALAAAGAAFGNDEFVAEARNAADFILTHSLRDSRFLLHAVHRGRQGPEGQAADYVFLVAGLLELYQATFDVDYLKAAIVLNSEFRVQFEDTDNGGFFDTSSEGLLPTRSKSLLDEQLASVNAKAFMNQLLLERMTADSMYSETSDLIRDWAMVMVARTPGAFPGFLSALDMAVGPSYEVVVVGSRDSPDTQALMDTLRTSYFPNKVVLFKTDQPGFGERLAEVAPFTRYQRMLKGKATAFVCQQFVCRLPTHDPATMISQLRGEFPAGSSVGDGP